MSQRGKCRQGDCVRCAFDFAGAGLKQLGRAFGFLGKRPLLLKQCLLQQLPLLLFRVAPGQAPEGKADAAIRFEQLGNELAKKHEVDILCSYPLSSFRDEKDEGVFQSICAEHSAVYSQ